MVVHHSDSGRGPICHWTSTLLFPRGRQSVSASELKFMLLALDSDTDSDPDPCCRTTIGVVSRFARIKLIHHQCDPPLPNRGHSICGAEGGKPFPRKRGSGRSPNGLGVVSRIRYAPPSWNANASQWHPTPAPRRPTGSCRNSDIGRPDRCCGRRCAAVHRGRRVRIGSLPHPRTLAVCTFTARS